MKRNDPFSLFGFEFIGREKELSLLNESIKRGQSIVLYAPLGEGKTALFKECCSRYKYSKKYVVMRCDLYGTCNMSGFIGRLIQSMKPFTTNTASNLFLSLLNSFRLDINYSFLGIPELRFSFSPKETETTLKQIKQIIESSSKKYLLYIDEFQEIDNYPDNNAAALLQSFFSSLPNLVCVISGSQNRMVKEILTTKMSSFYLNMTIIELAPIDCQVYVKFVVEKFKQKNVNIDKETVEAVYNQLEGSLISMQELFSNLYSKVDSGSMITSETIESEINSILSERALSYKYLLMRSTSLQMEYLVHLAHDIQPTEKKYIQARSKFVKEGKVSCVDNRYYFNNKFFRLWLRKQFHLSNNEESDITNSGCVSSPQKPISKRERDNLLISLAYLSAIEWPRSNEKALLIQLKEILTSGIFCPNSLRFLKIKKYLINREEASLDSNMVSEIKQYIKDIKSYK